MSTMIDTPGAALDVAELRTAFRGALLRPGEEGYDEARRIWNGAIDRRPALIARCAGADDVVEAIAFARERDLPVSVRGGGHAVAGHAVCDDGVMIDLSLMKAVRIDPDARTARAAGGALWADLDRASTRAGLATTGGLISHTGVGGLTLGACCASDSARNFAAADHVQSESASVRYDGTLRVFSRRR
jgi:FAD/FMN-containing dehydrogenase